jgi:hypothetical protein
VSTPTLVGNLPGYEQAALHAGYLVNAAEEPDEIVRRAQLAIFFGGRPFPSLPLAMARVGLGGELGLALDDADRVARIELTPPGRRVAVNGGGVMTINFRGPGYHFPYVGAIDLLGEEDVIPVQHDGVVEHKPRAEIFGDAYVFIGVTAIGARDLRNFPFGSNVPGTEGLATILDNILAGDAIRPGAGLLDWRLVLALMTVGALGFGALMVRLSALPAMLSALATIGVVALLDVYVVFGRWNVGLNTVFLLGELATLFVATVAVKYVVEERGKRFIRSTFSKYPGAVGGRSDAERPEEAAARRRDPAPDDHDVRPARLHRHGRAHEAGRGADRPQPLPRHDGRHHRRPQRHHRRVHRRRHPGHLRRADRGQGRRAARGRLRHRHAAGDGRHQRAQRQARPAPAGDGHRRQHRRGHRRQHRLAEAHQVRRGRQPRQPDRPHRVQHRRWSGPGLGQHARAGRARRGGRRQAAHHRQGLRRAHPGPRRTRHRRASTRCTCPRSTSSWSRWPHRSRCGLG